MGGAKDIFFKGKILEDAPTSYRIFDNPPLEQKKKYNHRPPPLPHVVLTRKVKYRQYDEMVERWMFKIEN